jgi:hypothetical protein
MFPKFTNIFEGITYDIRGNADRCEILAFRGPERFHVRVSRGESDGRNPALVALQKMERWFAHGEQPRP